MFYRRYGVPAEMAEINRMQREMERLFGAGFPRRFRNAPGYPALNVWTNDESALVTAELPGLEAKDVEISVVGNTLTLSGSRAAEALPENARYHRRERGCGEFTRSIELPFPVQAEKVEARLEKGVLQVTLPRAEEDKPRKITVKGS
jgi:HSP20 family protein